ncbi:MAG: Cell division protein FtsI [Peptidoglycan synthetase] [Candidatus Carbobacillus altaicus]|uniref:Cell division protein FtsI [Peptidoglycan synthetase] n=1 Tax=Candidatus Carbonibacillus altaicus TaxID=2163959 RepID=A0A2R6Y246_9BACL|nr:MAG: Cell division protein FtsI [Peptidoglycan synthetase] [Candidatus Carbobacillus altaicus]
MNQVVRRFNVLFMLIFFLFALLILRLTVLQLVDGELYAQAATNINKKVYTTPGQRGWIYDRNGVALAKNELVYSLSFLDEGFKKAQIEQIAINLEKIFQVYAEKDERYKAMNRVTIMEKLDAGYAYVPKTDDPTQRETLIKEAKDGTRFDPAEWELQDAPMMLYRHVPRKVAQDIPDTIMFQVQERMQDFPGIKVVVDARRVYPYGSLGAYIIGYTRDIPESKVEDYLPRGYTSFDRIGMTGVEASYEDVLHGLPGKTDVLMNNLTRRLETREVYPPSPGANIVLSIDAAYQHTVENILREEIKNLNTRPVNPLPNVKEAMAVVLNPYTGDVLAMAKVPGYDLNVFDAPDFSARYQTEVAGREQNVLVNGGYQPGSTFKMLTVMLALQDGLMRPDEKVLSTGGVKIGDRYLKDFKAGGHGWVDGKRALKESVNTYMYEVALRLARQAGPGNAYRTQFDHVREVAAQFGLGVLTGIDLNEEMVGYVTPDSSDFRQLGNLAQMMIGQYDGYTPMALAQYVSTIANGGYRVRPHLVYSVNEPEENSRTPGPPVYFVEGEVLGRVGIDARWIRYVQEGMREVTQPGGTAYAVFQGMNVPVAAKTGTVQRGTGQTNGVMVGYAPYDRPEIAFVVIVPGGSGGADSAGPIARRIVAAYFGDEPLLPLAGVPDEATRPENQP